MKPLLAVLAVLLLFPAAAAAAARPTDVSVAGGSLGAPPVLRAVPVQIPGTNVAAVDQQSPKAAPGHVAAPASSGFDWGTAAIGAAASLLLMTAFLGVAVTVRRRHSVVTG
jgi:hypothetical protein